MVGERSEYWSRLSGNEETFLVSRSPSEGVTRNDKRGTQNGLPLSRFGATSTDGYASARAPRYTLARLIVDVQQDVATKDQVEGPSQRIGLVVEVDSMKLDRPDLGSVLRYLLRRISPLRFLDSIIRDS